MAESFSSLVHSGSSECCYLLMRSSSFVGKVVIEGAAPVDGYLFIRGKSGNRRCCSLVIASLHSYIMAAESAAPDDRLLFTFW